jgi:hypothetical protein
MDCYLCTNPADYTIPTLWGTAPVCAKHYRDYGRIRSRSPRTHRRKRRPKPRAKDLPGQLYFKFMRL